MKVASLVIPLLAAACGSDATSVYPPIPGEVLDGIAASPGGSVSAQSVRPCGYKISEDWVNFDQSKQHDEITVTITYDGNGFDIAEQGVDGNHNVVMQNNSEYDAAGNLIAYTYERTDPPYDAKSTQFAAYDSFGRIVRYSEDDDGDGVIDVVTTFSYGGDGRRQSAHAMATSPLFGASANFDRTYQYDTHGRLIEKTKDVGYNGSADEVLLVDYDDMTRVETRTTKNLSGHVIENGTTHYDAERHIDNAEDTFTRADGSDVYVYAYLGGRQVSESLTSEVVRSTDLAKSQYVWLLTYTYERCN